MDIEHEDYARLSEAAVAAADAAATLDEYQIHLARAVRYASLASMARRASLGANVFPLRLAATDLG